MSTSRAIGSSRSAAPPALRWVILALTVVATIGLLVSLTSEVRQRFALASLLVGLLAVLWRRHGGTGGSGGERT